MKTNLKWALAVAVLCAGGAAAAEGPAGYVGLAAGHFWPATGGMPKEQGTGPIGELRLGWRATERLTLEASVGGFHVDGDQPPVNVTETTLGGLDATWLSVTVKGSQDLAGNRVRAFAGGGAGQYRFDAHLKDPPSTRRDASDDDLGVHLVGGLEFDATRRIGLGLEYRWVSVSPEGVELGGNGALLSAVVRF